MSRFARVGVIGAGAWGSALALLAARAGREVVLWARHEGPAPAGVARVGAPAALAGVDVALLAIPAQHLAEALAPFETTLPRDVPLILCAKGIERASGRFLSASVADAMPGRTIGALSGPGFADDVAKGLPGAVTIALPRLADAEALSAALASPLFRPYSADDVAGVEAGGALKNVYAIAAGVVIGLGFGESARAALLSRAYAEMPRFGRAIGARPETFTGLSGLGDLILTATSTQSRNTRFGLAMGRGEAPATALAAIGTVEGAATALALATLARRLGVDMPIADGVAALAADEARAGDLAGRLLGRPLRTE